LRFVGILGYYFLKSLYQGGIKLFRINALKKCSFPLALVPLLIGLTAARSYANVDVLAFSYDITNTGPLLTGTLTGALLPDNNTYRYGRDIHDLRRVSRCSNAVRLLF
jgi:hypothetical protein